MSKRKFAENYSYPSGLASTSKSGQGSTERSQKILKIIDCEFSKNVTNKTAEIFQIEERLAESKNLLAKVRFAVVASFYGKQAQASEKKNNEVPANQTSTTTSSATPPVQQQIHPSLKKLLGKTPINYDEILSIRPPREAAKTAASTIKEKLLSKKEEMKIKRMKGMLTAQAALVGEKKPRYTEPQQLHKPVPQMNAVRGRHQQKHLIVVGNTSKYIGDEKSADKFTHKWLVYISTKTKIPIEQIVSKVRFFLHSSYQPNDVCEVSCPPFTISRRGWGEFPIRIQLYFHQNIQQKPLQIIHNLVLDKKQTGLQTMGAETVVELWLNNTNFGPFEADTQKSDKETLKYPVSHTNKEVQHTVLVKSHLKNLQISAQTVQSIKQEAVLSINDMPYVEAITPTTTPQLKLETNQRLIPIPAPVTANHPPVVPPKPGKFIKCYDKNGKMSFVEVCYDPQNPKKILLKPNSSVIPIPMGNNNGQLQMASTGPSPRLFVKTVGNTAQKIFVASTDQIPPSVSSPGGSQITKPPTAYLNENLSKLQNGSAPMPIAQAIKIRARMKNQISLLKKGVSLLKPKAIVKPEPPVVITKLASADHDYYSNKCSLKNDIVQFNEMDLERSSTVERNIKTELEKRFLKVQFTSFKDAIDYLLKRIPLVIGPVAYYEHYRASFPFMMKSMEMFASLSIPKQRSFEWSRAKMVSRLIKKHQNLRNCLPWTTKEIVIYARKFAFTPPINSETTNSNLADHKNYLKEIVKRQIKREKIKYSSLSLNRAVYDWLAQCGPINHSNSIDWSDNSDPLINVVDDSNDTLLSHHKHFEETQHNTCLSMPLELDVSNEARFVTDLCSKINIKLQPEEIVTGVTHHSTKLVLIQALKCFVEDLLRRANEKRKDVDTVENDLIDALIRSDDIRRAVLDRFDFLTNTHMGLAPVNTP